MIYLHLIIDPFAVGTLGSVRWHAYGCVAQRKHPLAPPQSRSGRGGFCGRNSVSRQRTTYHAELTHCIECISLPSTKKMAPAHVQDLTKIVLQNLELQHDWSDIKTRSHYSARDLITGLPPRRLYVHPDEQVAIIRAEKDRATRIVQEPEYEWVLPLHLSEKWTLRQFAEAFDSIDAIPPDTPVSELDVDESDRSWKEWRGKKRGKRILLATVQDDSTVVYYLMHEGIVKPRQN
jgi:tRNA-splicing endonuclease subunit Sen15, fungi type